MSSSSTEHGIKLAVHVVGVDFGNLVAKVCECLLRRGPLSKAQISRFTELPAEKVKKSLLVLIQHNCVQAFGLEQDGGATITVVTQYMAMFDNIIHRLRFAKFMPFVSKELDKQGLEIFEGLLQHGRLTLTQSLDRALAYTNEGSSTGKDAYRESFIKLVNNRFVERCPAPEPLLSSDDDLGPKKGGGRSKIFVRELTLEQRALAAAIPMDAERFCIITDPCDDEKNSNNTAGAKIGEKRNHESLEWDSELDAMGGKKEPLWRVHFEGFINHLRIKACVDYVREEYDMATAMIVSSMLEGTKCTENTVSMSLEAIFEEVIKTAEGRTMNLDRVRLSLEQLQFCSESDDSTYSINLSEIIKKAQLEEVESIVLKRFGKEAFRIFRSLSNGHALHTDQISNQTFVDQKETPSILFRLWKDNFVKMEKISIGGGPKPSEIFSWKVKKDNLWNQTLDELYHAALNLCLRISYELEREREILSRPKDKVAGDLMKRRDHVRNVKILLDASLMKLDDAILLFHDFFFL